METASGVLGTGRSADGRTFTAEVEENSLQAGLVVGLEALDGLHLGLVLSVGKDGRDKVFGVVLGEFSPEGELARSRRDPFAEATVRVLRPLEIKALQASTGATMEIGRWDMSGSNADLRLIPKAFNRHTFLCGQSGSGKTYALGVILEHLILETRLPMIVLDPNGDFVHLAEARPDAPAGMREALANAGIDVVGTRDNPLFIPFVTLSQVVQAAALELDPVSDRAEYSTWLEVKTDPRQATNLDEIVSQLLSGDPDQRALAQRVRNLGIGEWSLWPRGREVPTPSTPPRVQVRDLSGFPRPAEAVLAGVEVVERLWANRESRQPTLLVIDEAHNLCPAEPETPLQKLLVNRLIQIAAEGRKYGIWLLLSSQRPSKVHPQVLSQCDNLVLMRMNSPTDLAELVELFGFAPEAMLAVSPHFNQGELLVAGGFVPVPSLGRVGPRLTREGGVDVRVPLA